MSTLVSTIAVSVMCVDSPCLDLLVLPHVLGYRALPEVRLASKLETFLDRAEEIRAHLVQVFQRGHNVCWAGQCLHTKVQTWVCQMNSN